MGFNWSLSTSHFFKADSFSILTVLGGWSHGLPDILVMCLLQLILEKVEVLYYYCRHMHPQVSNFERPLMIWVGAKVCDRMWTRWMLMGGACR